MGWVYEAGTSEAVYFFTVRFWDLTYAPQWVIMPSLCLVQTAVLIKDMTNRLKGCSASLHSTMALKNIKHARVEFFIKVARNKGN